MEFIYLGKIVNTHGLKGEIKILSDFMRKDLVFKPNFKLYIGEEKKEACIVSYRPHQKYDMVALKGYSTIEDVLKYKGLNVYINKDDLNLDKKEVLVDELIGYKIVKDKKIYGLVEELYKTKAGILLYIKSNKNFYIPYIEEFINNINKDTKEIEVSRVEELI